MIKQAGRQPLHFPPALAIAPRFVRELFGSANDQSLVGLCDSLVFNWETRNQLRECLVLVFAGESRKFRHLSIHLRSRNDVLVKDAADVSIVESGGLLARLLLCAWYGNVSP